MKSKMKYLEEIKKEYSEIKRQLNESNNELEQIEIRKKLKATINKILKLEKKDMPLRQLNDYHRELRKIDYENNEPVKGIEIRKKTQKILRQFLKLEQIPSKYSIETLSDERTKSDKPKVYVVTHVARYDIEASIEAIKENAHILWGDVGELYRSPEILLLKALGIVPVDVEIPDEASDEELKSIKEDRHISLETVIKILKQNGNVLIFSEGAWNTTDNIVVTKLFTGAVEAAIRGEADIVPVAVDKDKNNRYYVKIGRNIDTSSMKLEDKAEESEKVRSILAGLKYDIWEHIEKVEGPTRRSEMPDNAKEEYLNGIMKDSDNGYTLEVIEKTRYREKGITTPEEAFNHLGQIKVNKENAFLFEGLNPHERREQAKRLIKNR